RRDGHEHPDNHWRSANDKIVVAGCLRDRVQHERLYLELLDLYWRERERRRPRQRRRIGWRGYFSAQDHIALLLSNPPTHLLIERWRHRRLCDAVHAHGKFWLVLLDLPWRFTDGRGQRHRC